MRIDFRFVRRLAMGWVVCAAPLLMGIGRVHAEEQATKPAKPAAPQKKEQPFTPGGIWRAHDMNRPRPRVVTPGDPIPAPPPSDALVLFDGKDLSPWVCRGNRDKNQQDLPPKWKVENGYMEIVPKSGSIITKESFGDFQIHIEWATPSEVKGNGQGRGNSGVYLVGQGEIQVLDSFDNDTYPDGQAAALYGRYPPLVNACRKPGEWQSYDIFFEAPRLNENKKVIRPAFITVFHNGVLVHHHVEMPGTATECPILLQDHGNPVRYRNIWVRKLKGYDEP